MRKGLCANHLRDVEKFFPGAHITYNARNEDELDEDLLIEKLKMYGSEYRFKMKVEPVERALPVGKNRSYTDMEVLEVCGFAGTRYQKVNAVKEINSHERDKFWKKEEEEEKRRLEQEKQKKQEEQFSLEVERQRQEGGKSW